MKQNLSTCWAVWGNNSDIQVPVSPYCLNVNLEAVSVPPPGPGLPSFDWSWGLYSHVSICETAPCINRKITRLAFAKKCGALAASGVGGAPIGRCADEVAALALRPSSPARAR